MSVKCSLPENLNSAVMKSCKLFEFSIYNKTYDETAPISYEKNAQISQVIIHNWLRHTISCEKSLNVQSHHKVFCHQSLDFVRFRVEAPKYNSFPMLIYMKSAPSCIGVVLGRRDGNIIHCCLV